ncbi:amidohydrolase [Apiospora aurea]|uniref:Amidohydrolase n=1 Tax=Apiospora aurea TaxID=335848 RepID=A0ABR1QES5_9PEZI
MTIRTVSKRRGRSGDASGTSSLPSERLTRPIFSTGLGIAVRPKNWQPVSLRRDDEANAAAAAAAAKKKVFYTIVKDAALVVEGKLIAWVGAAADLPAKYVEAGHHRVFSVPTVMPGLWNVHTHFDGGGPEELPSYLGFATEHPTSQGARLARQCWESLQRGYDGDVFPLPAGDALLNLGVGNIAAGHHGTSMSLIVDGVDECRRACIKVLASGSVLSLDDDVDCAQFSAKEGILQALHAGVKTLEHVSFADDEVIELVKAKDVVWVATRTVIQLLLDSSGEGVPRKSWDQALRIADAALAGYKRAIADGGVTFALGTDTPPGFNMALELELAVQCGMTNLQAIRCATANGPLTLGKQAPKTGQLKVGYEADILGLTENPVEDVRILQQKENTKYVWKGGVLFKGPGVGPWGENYVFD